MIWLLPLSIAALLALFAIMRATRRVGELRDPANRFPADAPPLRTPADDFHDIVWLPLCIRAADAASARLARPLTYEERQALWKARSPLVLEILLKELAADPSPGAAVALLRTLPSGLARPDPTGWCEPASA
jgi:hypothetical protein